MKALLLASGVLAICAGCSSAEPAINLEGNWVDVKQLNSIYPTLSFTANQAFFTSRGDTLFRFSYSVDQPTRTLWLTDMYHERRAAKIIKATADSIVFAQLWEASTVQRFWRDRHSRGGFSE